MDIKELSLHGRMAYGLKCCLALCKKKNANIENLSVILYKLCLFTSSNNLSEWQDDVLPLTPECVFEAIDSDGNSMCRETRCYNYCLNELKIYCVHAKSCRFVTISERNEEEQRAHITYINEDEIILYMIQALYEIGASELYGAPGDCRESEQLLYRIIDVLKKNEVDIPDISEFGFQKIDSSVHIVDYYGTHFDSSYIIKEAIGS